MTASLLASMKEVMAWDRNEVAAFDLCRDDILVEARQFLRGIAGSVASARFHDFRSIVTSANAHALADESLAVLNIDCTPLEEDIAMLARKFLTQFGAAEGSLRVEVVDNKTCPKFHCDNVQVHLVTTYLGPATERIRADALHHRSPDEWPVAPESRMVIVCQVAGEYGDSRQELAFIGRKLDIVGQAAIGGKS